MNSRRSILFGAAFTGVNVAEAKRFGSEPVDGSTPHPGMGEGNGTISPVGTRRAPTAAGAGLRATTPLLCIEVLGSRLRMESDRPTVIPSPWTAASHEHPMFERLREITQAFDRAAILDASGIVVASLGGEEPRCPTLFDGVLGARPDLVTVSGSRGTSTLLALADGSFLWCEFPADVLVGEVFAAMAVLRPPPTDTPGPHSVASSPAGGKRSGNGRTEAVLARELEDPNVEGAFAIDRVLRRMHFASRDSAPSAAAMELVKRGGEIASEWIEGSETRPLRIFAQHRLTLFGIANGKPRSTWLAYVAPVARGVGFASVERLAENLDREREHTTLSFGAVRVGK